jgi:hypothetical protein
VKLAATLFEPQTPNGAAILVNSGTGIPRQFYGAFANHLALRGFAVLTYDYRAIGGSEAPPAATVEQWGAVDQASMIEHLARLRPGAALGLIGHSFGGQVLGLADNIADIDAAVLICSQSGHWRHWPRGRRRLRMLALWWFIPGLTAAASRAWIGTANLPRTSRSWARWGRSPTMSAMRAAGHSGRITKTCAPHPLGEFQRRSHRAAGRGRGVALLLSNAPVERRHLAPISAPGDRPFRVLPSRCHGMGTPPHFYCAVANAGPVRVGRLGVGPRRRKRPHVRTPCPRRGQRRHRLADA